MELVGPSGRLRRIGWNNVQRNSKIEITLGCILSISVELCPISDTSVLWSSIPAVQWIIRNSMFVRFRSNLDVQNEQIYDKKISICSVEVSDRFDPTPCEIPPKSCRNGIRDLSNPWKTLPNRTLRLIHLNSNGESKSHSCFVVTTVCCEESD